MNREGLSIEELFAHINKGREEKTMFEFVETMIDHFKYKQKYLKTKRKDMSNESYEILKSVLVELQNRFIEIRLGEGLEAIGNEPAKNHMGEISL